MASLAENITQTIADFDDIKAAIIEKGVGVPDGSHTSIYGDLIRQISSGGGTIPHAEVVKEVLITAGYDVSDDPNTWGQTIIDTYAAYDYKIDYSGLIFQYNDRGVTRTSTETAYCAYFNDNQGSWFFPIVIGATATSVEYTMYGYNCTAQGTIEIDGKTIYYNANSMASYQGAKDTSRYNRRYLGDNIPRSTVEDREKLVRQLYREIKIVGYEI